MEPSSFRWLERIELDGDSPHAVCVDRDGNRQVASFRAEASSLYPRGQGSSYSIELDLERLEVTLDASKFLWAAARLHMPVQEGHAIYQGSVQGRAVLIPAIALYRALIGRLGMNVTEWVFGNRNLELLFAHQVTANGEHDVVFSTLGRRVVRDTPQNRQLAAWFAAFPSARAMWASVRASAERGLLHMAMPNAKVRGSARGYLRSGGTLVVASISLDALIPNEGPYYAAGGITKHDFDLASAHVRNTSSESDLPKGRNGWILTDEEWDLVRPLLETRTSRGVREKVNVALIKQGSGCAWRELDAGAVVSWFYDIKYQGTWDEVRSILSESRKREAAGLPSES
mgnify:CR=1 FL=1